MNHNRRPEDPPDNAMIAKYLFIGRILHQFTGYLGPSHTSTGQKYENAGDHIDDTEHEYYSGNWYHPFSPISLCSFIMHLSMTTSKPASLAFAAASLLITPSCIHTALAPI